MYPPLHDTSMFILPLPLLLSIFYLQYQCFGSIIVPPSLSPCSHRLPSLRSPANPPLVTMTHIHSSITSIIYKRRKQEKQLGPLHSRNGCYAILSFFSFSVFFFLSFFCLGRLLLSLMQNNTHSRLPRIGAERKPCTDAMMHVGWPPLLCLSRGRFPRKCLRPQDFYHWQVVQRTSYL